MTLARIFVFLKIKQVAVISTSVCVVPKIKSTIYLHENFRTGEKQIRLQKKNKKKQKAIPDVLSKF